jgi:starch synthase (maltosyl-transferring)
MSESRIYYLHPLLAGRIEAWDGYLDRISAMGFDTVDIAPPFLSGGSGDLFRTANHDRLDPRLGTGDAVAALGRLAEKARDRGLLLMLDVVVDQVAAEALLRDGFSTWYRIDRDDEPPDPRRPPRQSDIADLCADRDLSGVALGWTKRLIEWADVGVAGFRCIRPHHAPSGLWRELISATRTRHRDVNFVAWTLGLETEDASALADCGFDRVTWSSGTWDYRAGGFADTVDRLAQIAPVIAMPEAPFNRRLSRAFTNSGVARKAARRALAFTTACGAGWLMPMGFEFGATRELDSARDRPEDFAHLIASAPFDLTKEITAANARCNSSWKANTTPLIRALSPPDAAAAALLLIDRPVGPGPTRRRLVLVNASLDDPARVPVAPLLTTSGLDGAVLNDEVGPPFGPDSAILIEPGGVRTLLAIPSPPVGRPTLDATEAAAASRIAIEAVGPSVEDGRFPAKRLVGDLVEVSADLISDGHDRLAAALLWRAEDEPDWREVPMTPIGNDRWSGRFPLTRLGRHLFTVLAWKEPFANFTDELEKKHAAGASIGLELEEGRLLIVDGVAQAACSVAPALAALAEKLGRADAEERRRLLLAPSTVNLMAAARIRPHACRHPIHFPVDAERRAAGFGSWYELFPRSQSGDVTRHGTFDDVIARLPAISAMGFDVLYLSPIHPIGRVNRKGRDNSPDAETGDPGSPYAIGSVEGGHDAVHPCLGTLDDFHRLREAAAQHRLELALDFAIQCAPDHPWLRDHPDWFVWRPDGSIRYAENPPKRYEDIVNVDFYADAAIPSLWLALRDIVLFWAKEGVRLFRVDNPHTKPLPFWEWMIAEVRTQYPDAVFLAEAFTRPKLMYRLAKIGFSQSYTYFTWRNTKAELTEYMTELTSTAREFFRPHFFVNTPDINPVFLQTSGRPGFLIRAALAATLSGLFGAYSGFELCEARALPGREEYASSEKYEIRAWDWEAAGNIIAEITRLNRIRRANPALQTHLGITFHNAFNDQVLYYSKATDDLQNVVLIAVNLDPHFPQECDIEVPLWLWGLSDAAAVAVTDLMDDHFFTWQGKMQHIRLDPAVLPFAIWRIRPLSGTA